jgi:hypothetical protein
MGAARWPRVTMRKLALLAAAATTLAACGGTALVSAHPGNSGVAGSAPAATTSSVSAVTTVPAATTSSLTATTTSMSGTTLPPAVTTSSIPVPLTTGPSWVAYYTAAMPSPPLVFGSSSTGWMVTGMNYLPTVDSGLSSGTGDYWPGTGVSRTVDSGKTWSQVLAVSEGVWGLNAVGLEDVWAVGVTTLYRSTNGGMTWTQGGQPAGTHLVAVAFTSAANGVGLTTHGSVVVSADGGLTWTSAQSGLAPAGAASGQLEGMCASAGTTFVADGAGAVWAETAPGAAWQQVFSGVTYPYSTSALIDCSTSGPAWEIVTVNGVPGAGDVLDVVRSPGGTATWTLTSTDGVRPSPLPFDQIPAVSSAPVVVDNSEGGPKPGVYTSSNGSTFALEQIPYLFTGQLPDILAVPGVVTVHSVPVLDPVVHAIVTDPSGGTWVYADLPIPAPHGQLTNDYATLWHKALNGTWAPFYQTVMSVPGAE